MNKVSWGVKGRHRGVKLCLMLVAVVALIIIPVSAVEGAKAFTPRVTSPEWHAHHYAARRGEYGWANGNCTTYAVGRFYEINNDRAYTNWVLPGRATNGGDGMAYNFFPYARTKDGGKWVGNTPKLGAVASWGGASNHVAIVEKIEGDTVTISESNYGGPAFRVRTYNKHNPGMNFQGYIYQPDVYTAKPQEPQFATGTENIGTNFYALIVNKKSWKMVTNVNWDAKLSKERWDASQVYHFERRSNGTYKITSTLNGSSLDVANFNDYDGANIAFASSNNSTAQMWRIGYGKTGFLLGSQTAPTRVLDIAGGSSAEGANIQLYKKNDSDAQNFAIYKVSPISSLSFKQASLGLKVGQKEQIYANGFTKMTPAVPYNNRVTFTSSDSSIVAIGSDYGTVIGKKPGKVTITATSLDGLKKQAQLTVTVATKPVTSVKLTTPVQSLAVGKTVALNASLSPSDATNKGVTYKSSNTNVATVDSTGKVTGKQAGTVTMTVLTKDSNRSASVKLTILPVKVSSVSLKAAGNTLALGKTLQLTPAITPAAATNKGVVYTSSNTGIATVDANGKVLGKKVGTVTLTVKTKDGNKTATVTIKIISVKVSGVSVRASTSSVKIGKTIQLTPTVTPVTASNKGVTYTSSNTGIATVDGNGKVLGKKVGTVTLTAKTKDGNKTAKVTVKVTK